MENVHKPKTGNRVFKWQVMAGLQVKSNKLHKAQCILLQQQ